MEFFHLGKETSIPTLNIDNFDHDTEKLLNEAKARIVCFQFCGQALARMQAQVAANQTARVAYAKALQDAVSTATIGDKIKFN